MYVPMLVDVILPCTDFLHMCSVDRDFQSQRQAQLEVDSEALEQREREMHQLEVSLPFSPRVVVCPSLHHLITFLSFLKKGLSLCFPSSFLS